MKINLNNATIEEIRSVYLDIVRIHGGNAYKSDWLSKNGYNKLTYQIRKRKIHWIKFREECGIKGVKRAPIRKETLEELMEIYKTLIKKHGEKAYSSDWLRRKGHQGLLKQVRSKHDLTWNEFRKKCGIDKVFIRKIMSIDELIPEYLLILKKHGKTTYRTQSWMGRHGYRWMTDHVRKSDISWVDFNRKIGFKVKRLGSEYDIDELVEEYKKVVKKHGENAYRSTWMTDNGYLWLYQRSRKLGFYWDDFRKKCEFNNTLQRKKFRIKELLEEFKPIKNEHGDNTCKIKWMMNNGYRWITEQVLSYDIKWSQFVQMSKDEIEMEFHW